MKQIDIKDINKYCNEYFYYKQENAETDSYIIFKLIDVNDNIATISGGYLFNVPKANWHAFLYPIRDNQLLLNSIKKIYVLTRNEYVNTYLIFFTNDKRLSTELPTKIIQDEII